MAGVYENRADSLFRKDDDKGFHIGWKLKYGFEKGHIGNEMTYGEAKKQAAEMQAKEPDKVFYPEMIMVPKF